MPPLPFLRLPLIAQARIINFSTLKDVITLSSCSQKTCTVLNSSAFKVAKVQWKIEKNYFKISITCRDSESFHIQFLFSTGYMTRYDLILNTIPLSYNSKNMLITHHRDNVPFEKISEFVLNAFRIQMHSLETDIDHFPTNSPIWKYFKNLKIEDLKIGGKQGPEDVRRILEDVKTSGTLNLQFDTEEGYTYSKGLTHQKVKIRSPTWLHVDAILSSESRMIYLKMYRPTNQELKSVIQKWITGTGLLNLSRLDVTPPKEKSITETDLEEILLGIDTFQWRNRGHRVRYPLADRNIRLDDAPGFVRQTDGKPAACVLFNGKWTFMTWDKKRTTSA